MILFSPPRCDTSSLTGKETKLEPTTTTYLTSLFSTPLWTPRTRVALRSLQEDILPQPLSQSPRSPHTASSTYLIKTQSSASPTSPTSPTRDNMSSPLDFHSNSPRTHSQSFSPTLNSIPEVFEYPDPPPNTSTPPTPLENSDVPIYVLPEPATPVRPTLSLRPTKSGIILSPGRAKTTRVMRGVTNVLKNVLEADRLRRRAAMRIYLKAIMFLKLLLKSHERYGALMATQGLYMQR